jgi:hypothetical protein
VSAPQARGKQHRSDLFQAQKHPYGIILVYLKISVVIALTKRNEDNGEGMWSDVDASPMNVSD